MALRAVVLDLDGTLLDHPGAARSASLRWLRGLGATGTDDELFERWAAAEDRNYVRFERGEITHREQRRERLREILPGLGLDLPGDVDGLDALFATFLREYEASWVAYDDALPAVRALRAAGLRLAVLTNGVAVQQRAKCAAIGVTDLLTDGVFATDELPAAKPSPLAYAAVAQALGLAPDDLVMVGDNPVNDVAAARSAGWGAVWVDRGDHAPAEAPAGPRVATLADLPAELRRA